MKFKAVLFDFDGVIADTMEDNYLAWHRAFKHYNVEISKQEYFLLEGLPVLEVARTLSGKHGLENADFHELAGLKGKYYRENHSFRFYPEVQGILENLRSRDLLTAIVSASTMERLKHTLAPQFLRAFDSVVSGDDTPVGKPNPAPYLKAIRDLNLKPPECVVVENAPLGITAAKKAGAYCVALTTTLERKYLQEADKILENHKQLAHYFAFKI